MKYFNILFSIIQYQLTTDFKYSIWLLFHTRTHSYDTSTVHLTGNISQWNNVLYDNCIGKYSWLSLSRIRLTRISSWVEFLSKSRTSLCINIYNLTPVESNSDESKFRLSRIKVLVSRCRKPYYLHSLSQIYLSKHVYYLGIKIGSQVKHPVIEFDIFTLGYFTCLFHNLSN